MTRNAVRFFSRALLLLCGIHLADAATNAQTFTYQGRFMDAAGTAPLTGQIDITFSIYDPAVTCLLYQETQTNIDLTSTAGVFSAQVGSATGSSKRTAGDPGLSMAQIFANNTQIRANGAAHCTNGYTPAAGDSRVLRVTVLPHSTGVPTTISPDQTINSVPQAQTAETLQGLVPQSFIQSAAGVAGQANVSLTTLETLTGGVDASSLHNHDSLYVKIGTSGSAANLGTTAYTTGNALGIGTTVLTGNLSFSGSSGVQTIIVDRDTTTNSAGSNLSIAAGGASTSATNQNGGNLVLSGGISTGTGSSSIQFQTSSSGSSGTADNTPSTKMVLNSTGELGVNTLNPGAQLEVDTAGASTLGEIIKASASQSGDLLELQNSTGSVLTKFDSSGYLTLPGSPTSSLQAATKQYVDSSIAGATAGVATFNGRNGAVTLSSSDVTGALTYTPLKNSTDTMTGSLTIDQILGIGGAAGSNTQLQSTSTSATNVTAVLKEAASQTADILELQNSSGTVLSKVDSNGMLTLVANPTSTLQAATKAYVDTAISSVSGATAGVANGGTGDTTLTANGLLVGNGTSAVTSVPTGTSGYVLTSGGSGAAPTFSQINLGSSAALTGTLPIANGGTGTGTGSITGTGALTFTAGGTNQNVTLTPSGTGYTLLNGMVGIGTSTPSYPLHVYGNSNSDLQVNIQNDYSGKAANILLNANSYYAALGINGSSGSSWKFGMFGSSNFELLDASGSGTYPFQIEKGAPTNALYVKSAGYVGIGTSNPTSALELKGVFTLDGSTSGTTTIQAPASGGVATLTLPSSNGTGGQFLTTDGSGNLSWTTSSSANASSLSGQVSVANGGTGLSAGTSGGIPYFNSTSTMASSGALTANAIILGGGAGASPTSLGAGTSGQLLNSQGSSAPAWTSSPTISGTLGVGGAVGSSTQLQSTSTSETNVTEVLKEASSQTADVLDIENNSGTVLSKFDSSGMLTLPSNPTSSLQAATKGYVDTAMSSAATNWASPGAIGSTTPNSGAFTTLSTSGALTAASGSSSMIVTPGWESGNGTWINLDTAGPSGIGTGGVGSNAWIAYASANGNWFTNAVPGDIAYRNTAGNILMGTSGGTANMVISTSGNVGINTPVSGIGTGTALRVNGQVAATSSSSSGASIDWSLGNASSTSYDCTSGNLSFANIRDGGAYTLAVTNASTAQCNFNTATTGDDSATVTYRFLPANAARIANSHTLYSLQRIGSIVYVSWQSGY